MDAKVIEGAINGWTKEQYLKALLDIIRAERKALKLGERVLNKNFSYE